METWVILICLVAGSRADDNRFYKTDINLGARTEEGNTGAGFVEPLDFSSFSQQFIQHGDGGFPPSSNYDFFGAESKIAPNFQTGESPFTKVPDFPTVFKGLPTIYNTRIPPPAAEITPSKTDYHSHKEGSLPGKSNYPSPIPGYKSNHVPSAISANSRDIEIFFPPGKVLMPHLNGKPKPYDGYKTDPFDENEGMKSYMPAKRHYPFDKVPSQENKPRPYDGYRAASEPVREEVDMRGYRDQYKSGKGKQTKKPTEKPFFVNGKHFGSGKPTSFSPKGQYSGSSKVGRPYDGYRAATEPVYQNSNQRQTISGNSYSTIANRPSSTIANRPSSTIANKPSAASYSYVQHTKNPDVPKKSAFNQHHQDKRDSSDEQTPRGYPKRLEDRRPQHFYGKTPIEKRYDDQGEEYRRENNDDDERREEGASKNFKNEENDNLEDDEDESEDQEDAEEPGTKSGYKYQMDDSFEIPDLVIKTYPYEKQIYDDDEFTRDYDKYTKSTESNLEKKFEPPDYEFEHYTKAATENLAKDPNCERMEAGQGMKTCFICRNSKTGGSYEQCSYESDPKSNKYSYQSESRSQDKPKPVKYRYRRSSDFLTPAHHEQFDKQTHSAANKPPLKRKTKKFKFSSLKKYPNGKMRENLSNENPPESYNGPRYTYEGPSSPYEGPSSPYEGPSSPYEGPSSPYEGPESTYEGPTSPYEVPTSAYEGISFPSESSSSPYEGLHSGYEGPKSSYEGPDHDDYYDRTDDRIPSKNNPRLPSIFDSDEDTKIRFRRGPKDDVEEFEPSDDFFGSSAGDYRFGPEYFEKDAEIFEVKRQSPRKNHKPEDEEVEEKSQYGNLKLFKNGDVCERTKKNDMTCMKCLNKMTGAKYEQCQYSQNPKKKSYSYGGQKYSKSKPKRSNKNDQDADISETRYVYTKMERQIFDEGTDKDLVRTERNLNENDSFVGELGDGNDRQANSTTEGSRQSDENATTVVEKCGENWGNCSSENVTTSTEGTFEEQDPENYEEGIRRSDDFEYDFEDEEGDNQTESIKRVGKAQQITKAAGTSYEVLGETTGTSNSKYFPQANETNEQYFSRVFPQFELFGKLSPSVLGPVADLESLPGLPGLSGTVKIVPMTPQHPEVKNKEGLKLFTNAVERFKMRDWSKCKKIQHEKIVCYECNQGGIIREECMFTQNSSPNRTPDRHAADSSGDFSENSDQFVSKTPYSNTDSAVQTPESASKNSGPAVGQTQERTSFASDILSAVHSAMAQVNSDKQRQKGDFEGTESEEKLKKGKKKNRKNFLKRSTESPPNHASNSNYENVNMSQVQIFFNNTETS